MYLSMKKITLFSAFMLTFTLHLSAQKVLDATETVKEMDKTKEKAGWTRVGGIGLDFSLLSLINPRSGAGDNRFGFGGLLTYQANLKRNKLVCDNKFGVQLAVAKIGNDAYTKANDVLQVTTQIGYKIDTAGKWYIGGLGDFQSQFLPTYGVNYLKETVNNKKESLTGKFLSPAIFKLAPGIIHKPNKNLTFLFSPVALRMVIVMDDTLAASGKFFPAESNKNIDFQLGAELRADFTKKFFNDKLLYTTTFDIYSNYLRDPQNMAVEWYNSLDFMVFKNISVNLKTDWFYDHNILVYKDGDANQPTRNVFFRNALLMKYAKTF